MGENNSIFLTNACTIGTLDSLMNVILDISGVNQLTKRCIPIKYYRAFLFVVVVITVVVFRCCFMQFDSHNKTICIYCKYMITI